MPEWRTAGQARLDAKVAELADAPDLGSGSRKAMGVRLPPFAPAFARFASYGWQAIEACPPKREGGLASQPRDNCSCHNSHLVSHLQGVLAALLQGPALAAR